MRLCEVELLSCNVRKLADFYKTILEIDNGSDDDFMQVLIDGDTRLVIFNDRQQKTNNNTNIGLIFECEDVDAEYKRLRGIFGHKLHVIDEPHDCMFEDRGFLFYDIDGNKIFMRSRRK